MHKKTKACHQTASRLELVFGENILISFHEDLEKRRNFEKVLYVNKIRGLDKRKR
jgi:hypothetical protein